MHLVNMVTEAVPQLSSSQLLHSELQSLEDEIARLNQLNKKKKSIKIFASNSIIN